MVDQYRYIMTLMYVLTHIEILRRKRRGIEPQGIQMKNNTVTVIDNATGKRVELPILEGSQGPDTIDVRGLYGELGYFTYDPGYLSTASCESKITYIDGEKGILLYRGYPIEQLAKYSTYPEVCYLLL